MFAPFSRSKFASQSICPSCVSTLSRQPNLSRRQTRYNSLTTGGGIPPTTEPGEVILPIPKALKSNQYGEKKTLRRASKVKATVSSNGNAFAESLSAALSRNGEQVGPSLNQRPSFTSVRPRQKEKVRAAKRPNGLIRHPKPISNERLRGRPSDLKSGMAAGSKRPHAVVPRRVPSHNPKPPYMTGRAPGRRLQAMGREAQQLSACPEPNQTADPTMPIVPKFRPVKPGKTKGSKTIKKTGSASSSKKLTKEPGMTAYEIETVDATALKLVPIENPQPPVPSLAYGLERVLFNPGVYHLRDPRSRVFNFDPYLESIMPVADFDFNALKEYITSSRDESLLSAAALQGKKYTGSTSSMTSVLAHFHFLLSQWRPVNISNLSQGFPDKLQTFTLLQRAPSAIFLRWKNGTYAIDADKEFQTANILMMLGKSMEKLLTLPTENFEKYRKENSDQISEEERNEAEAYHYTTMGDFLMRSQLDAYDPRIPGTGMFDLKTRAVVSIRMDAADIQNGLGYEIRTRHGEFESFEREYYDMIRAAFLKYSLQVRMGRMDGIFVAFHNTERIFGFQYISLPEMDLALHGREDLNIGDSEFKLSLALLNQVLDRAIAKYPEQSLRVFFETRDTKTPFMYIFAEPVTEDEIQSIQDSKKDEIEDFERTILGVQRDPTAEEIKHRQEAAEWEELQAKVEDSMDTDEMETVDEIDTADEISSANVVPDSDHYRTSSVGEPGPSTFTEPSDEHFPERNLEVEYPNVDTAKPCATDEKEVRNDDAIDATYKEQQLKNTSCSTLTAREDPVTKSAADAADDFRPEESRIDTLVLPPEAEAVDQIADETRTDSTTEKILETEAATLASADHAGNHGSDPVGTEKDLLAMTLTIRNKINGSYVVRPEKMGPKDRWSVEYALAEVPTLEQSWSLYEKAKRRRKLTLKFDKKDEKSNWQRSYVGKLARISSEGRKWRQKQNNLDRENPITVLRDEMQSSA